jgi:hypothetical protein
MPAPNFNPQPGPGGQLYDDIADGYASAQARGSQGGMQMMDDIGQEAFPAQGQSFMATSDPAIAEASALFDDALRAGMSPAEAEQFVMEMYMKMGQ